MANNTLQVAAEVTNVVEVEVDTEVVDTVVVEEDTVVEVDMAVVDIKNHRFVL